jgi:cation:H+ antiporter
VSASLAVPVFLAGALVSLCVSWLLVSRLERVGERLGFSEGLLGVIAALAADAPEITSAVTALAHHEQRVGAGVTLGSGVFNLAALLGLGAVLAGRVGLHRKVIVLGGAVAVWIGATGLAAVLGLVSPLVGLVMALVALVPYIVVLGRGRRGLGRLPLPRGWIAWLASAVAEEESELAVAIRPPRGRARDVAVASGALVIVVAASAAMERAASVLGRRYGVSEIVVGGIVLAGVTSLPNAVAGNYLASRGRGAAVLSTSLNSNNLNVAAGLLLPAALLGLGRPSGETTLVAAWYLGLTVFVLAFAYADRGLRRGAGLLIIGAYGVFLATLLATAHATSLDPRVTVAPAAAIVAACVVSAAARRRRASSEGRP